MSIAPPSDIVLDVAQAADPQRLQEAQAKLARMAAGAPSADFAAVMASAPPLPSASPPKGPFFPMAPAVHTKPTSPYQKFEAVLLQNLVDNILPKDSNLFGDTASADVNRSMLAEQLAVSLAKTNKIGIARMIEKAHLTNASGAVPQAQAARLGPMSDIPLTALSLPATLRRTE